VEQTTTPLNPVADNRSHDAGVIEFLISIQLVANRARLRNEIKGDIFVIAANGIPYYLNMNLLL
jgi:hypothetical protein